MNSNNKGFTLAELLIVVAIIAVLVGISIPVFTAQLEKAKEAKDLSNVRSAYAELMIAVLVEDETSTYGSELMYKGNGTYSLNVPLSQSKHGWEDYSNLSVAGVSSNDSYHWIGLPNANGNCKVEYRLSTDEVFFYWDGVSAGDSGQNPGNNTPESSTPESNAPINTLVGQIDAKKEVMPANLTSDESFNIELGGVYSFNDKIYVSLTSASFNQYYYATPLNSDWAYRELDVSDTSKIKTKVDLVPRDEYSSDNTILKEVQPGDLYQTDNGDLYIRKAYSSNTLPPPYDSENWVFVKYR